MLMKNIVSIVIAVTMMSVILSTVILATLHKNKNISFEIKKLLLSANQILALATISLSAFGMVLSFLFQI